MLRSFAMDGDSEPILVRRATEGDLEAIVRLWHETSNDTYGFLPTERGRTLDDRRSFFLEHVAPRCTLWMALRNNELNGMLAISGHYIDRLYVHPASQRQGVGAALLEHARTLSPQKLELHTHQENRKARAFYEKHGFVATAFGTSPPPESTPDVAYQWTPSS